VPKLWDETIESHRRAVRDATLDATAALVSEHGLAAVTMSQIAKDTGIGRATLYKYFPDVESILLAWHERQINEHLQHLAQVRDNADSALTRLEAVLEAFALISHQRHDSDLAALLHRGEHVTRAHQHLHDFVRDLVADAAATGDLRQDISADELTTYCLHALTAAGSLPTPEAVYRLVHLTLTGLRPEPGPGELRTGRRAPE
jgi:AcrR family transcriptional regulator